MTTQPKVLSVLSLLGLVAVVGCDGGTVSKTGTETKKALADRPECPHEWTNYFNDSVYLQPSPRFFPLSNTQFVIPSSITGIPEFHDCQKLLVERSPGDTTYGELAAVFVRYNIKQLYGVRQNAPTPPISITRNPAGALVSTPGPGQPVGGRTTPTSLSDTSIVILGLAVAEVVSEGDYLDLGIKTGFNCLFLAGTGGSWSAVMISFGLREENCADLSTTLAGSGGARAPLPTTMSFTKLWVKPSGVFPDDDVPPVARWDWDPKGYHMIGVVCENRWCDVGPEPAMGPPPHGSAPRTKAVKGWYDEQRVAYYDPASHKPVTSKNMGTVFPDVALATYTLDSYNTAIWLPAAHVALTDASTDYSTKYGFQQASPGEPFSRMNHVSLCKGDAARCGIPSGTLPTCNTGWFAKSEFRNQTPKYFCVHYYNNGANTLGLVRWRWRALDETIWISCPQGCCEVDAT